MGVDPTCPDELMAESRPRGRRALDALHSGVTAARELELPGARVRRVRRMGSRPLARLADVHPEARLALPIEIGLRTIDVSDIAGTAVAGGNQRGGDFLPLRQFRGKNWHARWQRLQKAQDRLATLPPIEVTKYGGSFWVVDGHNRVAIALYAGQVGIDADITELVPSGGRRTEPIGSLAASTTRSSSVRAAGGGRVASSELAREDLPIPLEPDDET